MKQRRKHVLEFFQNDPWPVRVGVLAMRFIFLLAMAALLSGLPDKLRSLASLLRSLH